MSSLLITERSGGVLTLRFNRPDKFNSFVREMALAVQDALDEARDNAEIRAVRIIGSGKAFCAGQDLVEATAADGPSLSRIVSEHYNPIILKMRDLSLPIVCAVNGVACSSRSSHFARQSSPEISGSGGKPL